MLPCPVANEPFGLWRQRTLEQGQFGDGERRDVARVARVEVRDPVLLVEHLNRHPVETADRRHPAIMRLRPDTTPVELPVRGTDEDRKSVARLVAGACDTG